MEKTSIKGEYIPTEEDIDRVKQWVNAYHDSCFPPYRKDSNINFWNKKTHDSLLRLDLCMTGSNTFYISKAFPFIMDTKNGPKTVQLKIFKSKKQFKRFIYNSGYLISRCLVGRNMLDGQAVYAIYYHKEFGNVGWFKGRLQYILQKFCDKKLLNWFYDIEKIKFPSIHLTITNKCDG